MLDDGGRLRRLVLAEGGERRPGVAEGGQSPGAERQQGRRFSRGGADSVEMTDERASRLGCGSRKRGGRLCLTRCGKGRFGAWWMERSVR